MRKSPKYWRAYQDGLVPKDWPLLRILTAETMLTRDGEDHTRLRQPIRRAFTAHQVEALRGRVEDITRELLGALATAPSGDRIDLRATFAFQLPVRVICELSGVDDDDMRRQLAVDTRLLLSRTAPLGERLGARAGVLGTMTRLIASERALPGPTQRGGAGGE